jgi:hypothetical protein
MSPAGHLKVVDECDYYVLVIGARYGSTDAAGRHNAERTALRWPKIPLVSASLKCEVRTADTSSMPKRFAAATCPWLSLQGNDRDDSHLVGVLR